MKKNISFVLVLLIAVTCVFTLTGCQENNNVELTALAKERVSNTYWRWVDTGPTANNVKVYTAKECTTFTSTIVIVFILFITINNKIISTSTYDSISPIIKFQYFINYPIC